jgi:hypothetical protein
VRRQVDHAMTEAGLIRLRETDDDVPYFRNHPASAADQAAAAACSMISRDFFQLQGSNAARSEMG